MGELKFRVAIVAASWGRNIADAYSTVFGRGLLYPFHHLLGTQSEVDDRAAELSQQAAGGGANLISPEPPTSW